MSKRHQVEARLESLGEIRTIMDSMKNLAVMETAKLSRYHQTQQHVVDAILRAVNDVRVHYAPSPPSQAAAPPLYLLLGAERGFCGGYNERLVATLRQQPHRHAPILAVGSRLAATLASDYPHAITLPGATVADEIDATLQAITAGINQLRRQHGPLQLHVIHTPPEAQPPRCQPALPPAPERRGTGMEPLINLAPAQLMAELLEHYLFAVTHHWLIASLLAENQQRLQHLEQATQHLDRERDALHKRRNTLRQEEIIEEIEVILLNSEGILPR